MNKMYPLYTHGKLDAQSEKILNQITEAKAPPTASMTPQQAREYPLVESWTGKSKDGVDIENMNIPSVTGNIPLRIFTPVRDQSYPIVVFFHGGGFVVGTLDEFDPFCTFLATGASCIVVSIDYRLAPEHKHPAAVDDAVAAVNWVAKYARDIGGDPTRIAVAGDSAGANLATVVSLIARDQGFPRLAYQVLICPWVDTSSFDTDSFRCFGEGLWLSKATICWYRDHYLCNQEQATFPFVSPLLAEDVSGLPPALVITAEFDVLRDQGEAYAHRLREAGISVQLTRYSGMLHDFAIFPGIFDQAKDAIDEISDALRRVFWVTCN
jgi:acetyl esterase